MNPIVKRMPILTRLWRVVRMALGIVFGRRELWTVVEAPDPANAIEDARSICPHPELLLGITVDRLPGLPDCWRVTYIYRGRD